MTSRFRKWLFGFTALALVSGHRLCAFAAEDDALTRAHFDRLVIPAVESAVRQSGTNLGGNIAWSQAYQLAALVEMLEVTRDAKYVQLIVRLGTWIADARDDRHGFRDEVRDRALPAWSSTNYSKGQRYVWAVHTGVIATPMAQFAATIRRVADDVRARNVRRRPDDGVRRTARDAEPRGAE